jgi:hypothetical protein
MQGHQLIAWSAGKPGRSTRLDGADSADFTAHVHHDDLVAETVHLDEREIGERAHPATD